MASAEPAKSTTTKLRSKMISTVRAAAISMAGFWRDTDTKKRKADESRGGGRKRLSWSR